MSNVDSTVGALRVHCAGMSESEGCSLPIQISMEVHYQVGHVALLLCISPYFMSAGLYLERAF